MRTIELEEGKYRFDLDANGRMHAAFRNGEPWSAGFELRFTNVFMVALRRIAELEADRQEGPNK